MQNLFELLHHCGYRGKVDPEAVKSFEMAQNVAAGEQHELDACHLLMAQVFKGSSVLPLEVYSAFRHDRLLKALTMLPARLCVGTSGEEQAPSVSLDLVITFGAALARQQMIAPIDSFGDLMLYHVVLSSHSPALFDLLYVMELDLDWLRKQAGLIAES